MSLSQPGLASDPLPQEREVDWLGEEIQCLEYITQASSCLHKKEQTQRHGQTLQGTNLMEEGLKVGHWLSQTVVFLSILSRAGWD